MPFEEASHSSLAGVFGLVANEARVDVVHRLWEAYPEPLQFSELRSRVDIEDSGTFNYHLNQLQPAFVQAGDDGYTLTYAGRQLVGAIASGRLTDSSDESLTDVDAGHCFHCEGTLGATYDDGAVRIVCSKCEERILEMGVPPVTVRSIDPASLPSVVSRHVLTKTQKLGRGFCPLCHGTVEASLTPDAPEESVTYREDLDVRFDCQECGAAPRLNLGAVLMDHPAVVACLYDAGVDIRETYVWELVSLLDPETTVASQDPLELDVVFDIDGEELELRVDESATVVSHERPTRRPAKRT